MDTAVYCLGKLNTDFYIIIIILSYPILYNTMLSHPSLSGFFTARTNIPAVDPNAVWQHAKLAERLEQPLTGWQLQEGPPTQVGQLGRWNRAGGVQNAVEQERAGRKGWHPAEAACTGCYSLQ